MKQTHFYSVSSRLGLYNPPNGSTAHNVGVEFGGEAVLKALETNAPYDHFTFSQPEAVDKAAYYETIARESLQAKELILKTLQKNETPLFVGGDHSISFATIMALSELHSIDETAIIMFDSHADIHLAETSPSGNFHGMWLRPFFTTFDIPQIEQLLPQKFSSNQLCYVGNLLTESAEDAFLAENKIKVYSKSRLTLDKMDRTLQDVSSWLESFKHVHISFDIDVFTQDLAPAVGTPNPQGLLKSDVGPILNLLSDFPSTSIDLVEVNPEKNGGAQTVQLATEVIKLLVGR